MNAAEIRQLVERMKERGLARQVVRPMTEGEARYFHARGRLPKDIQVQTELLKNGK